MAKPVEFKGANIVIGKGRTDVDPLPVLVDEAKMISCWELSEEELELIKKEKKVYLIIYTYGQPMQPAWVGVNNPIGCATNQN